MIVNGSEETLTLFPGSTHQEVTSGTVGGCEKSFPEVVSLRIFSVERDSANMLLYPVRRLVSRYSSTES